MEIREQKNQARLFVERWKNRGNERQDSQSFWIDLLQSVYGVEKPTEYITFEDTVKLDNTSFIDAYIDKTKVMIEQKGANKDLSKAIKQSDGSYLTPFQQAKRYSANLPYSQRPRWIVTCNFKEFYIYDMEQPNSEAIIIYLSDLETEFYRLEFLVDKSNEHIEQEMEVSIKAGDIVGEIYKELLKQYVNPNSTESLHAINQLCVRLVFCFYADDAGIFGKKSLFRDYLEQFNSKQFRRALIDLFDILDTPISMRDPYIDDELMAFPYVNGGMFSDKNIEIPNFTNELRELILEHASSNFNWADISPTIFGAVFESTLNPDTRRIGGMHYTSIENIHKVIDPLFLDDLKDELNELRNFKQLSTLERKAKEFQNKLAKLTFLDPACGSGNFLTETYISLRRLENEAIKLYKGNLVYFDLGEDIVKVKLEQFYGIEINDFAVSVAKTALWIAESQMLEATKEIIYAEIDFLPLKSYTNIIEGDALLIDWEEVVSIRSLNFIIGNPPFLGYSLQNEEQKKALKSVYVDENGKTYKTAGKIDFVAGWYFKASKIMENTDIRTAFVSTNSICQGEQANNVWKPLVERFNIHIDFAYQTFKWESEASKKAAVHCVIVGFSHKETSREKIIFGKNTVSKVNNINSYLLDGDMIFIESRMKPLCDVPKMIRGSQPTDNGNLILTEEEKNELLLKEPQAETFIRPFLMGADFINRKTRYCIWLVEADPKVLRTCPMILERVKKVRAFRLSSKKESTRKKADIPTLFDEIKESTTEFIAIPKTSSSLRRYIPMDYLPSKVIAGDAIRMIPNADKYIFGILNSNVHMAWMRVVAGRLKSDYSYSNTIVYNNFPFPEIDELHKSKIRNTAQGILDARNKYPESSLADLYNELTMPVELRKAHQMNDKAVMEAYEFIKLVNNKKTWFNETETVSELFKMYETLIED